MIFATAGAAAYPVTGEILLPMVVAAVMCLLSALGLLGLLNGLREEAVRRG